jgi:hypothetical protein
MLASGYCIEFIAVPPIHRMCETGGFQGMISEDYEDYHPQDYDAM